VLLHPDSSWRFLSNPFTVSLTWMLDRENLGEKNILPENKNAKRRTLYKKNSLNVHMMLKQNNISAKQTAKNVKGGGRKDRSPRHTLAAKIKEG